MKKDYYEVLGIQKGANDSEIKRAYRKLAQKYHPDTGAGDEAKFKGANEAYQILSDPQKRQAYDQFGHNNHFGQGQGQGQGGFDWSQYANGQGFSGDFDFSDLGGFSDIFENFFSGGGENRERGRERQGSDLETSLTLDFKESVLGAEKELSLNKYNTCERCKGSGGEPGTSQKTCQTCKGKGTVEIARRTIFGNVLQRETCPDCLGAGRIPEKACNVCKGEGRTKSSKKIKIQVPSGIKNGEAIRIRGEGEAPKKGGAPGDLYVRIFVKPTSNFRREEMHILNSIEISFPEVALGTTVDVLTVDGNIKLKIPAGTQSGKIFKISEKGVLYRGRRGDHLVTINVKTPEKLTLRQKQLFEELQKEEREPKKRWFG